MIHPNFKIETWEKLLEKLQEVTQKYVDGVMTPEIMCNIQYEVHKTTEYNISDAIKYYHKGSWEPIVTFDISSCCVNIEFDPEFIRWLLDE